MTALQAVYPVDAGKISIPSAYKIAKGSRDKGVVGIAVRSGVAALAAIGSLTTSNAALSYSFHYETALTNPKISLPDQETDWLDEDSPALASFLSFLGEQMIHHPELTVPADEVQLSRIKALVAGVRI